MNVVPFTQAMQFAARPELFLSHKKKIVRADKIIKTSSVGSFNIEGARMRMNIPHAACRESMANGIQYHVTGNVIPTLKNNQSDLSFIGREGLRQANGSFEIRSYSETYGETYLTVGKMLRRKDERLIQLLDAVVANLSVVIDPNHTPRDLNNITNNEWIENGLRYNTLSNYWIQSYQLMSFVIGLSRFCVLAVALSTKDRDYVKPILKTVNPDDIYEAIATGNVKLALKNWNKMESIVVKSMGSHYGSYPLKTSLIPAFQYFLKKGTNFWFKDGFLKSWEKANVGTGWERFLEYNVHRKMMQDKS